MSERDLYGRRPGEVDPPPLPRAPEAGDLPGWLQPPDEPERLTPPGDDRAAPPPAEPAPTGWGTIALAVVAGLLAAVAGAAVWGLVAQRTSDELGIFAWGVGLLVGLTIRFVARRRAYGLQLVAVATSLVGIVLGKYLAFALVTQDEFGTDLGLFSSDTVDVFRRSLGDVFTAFDLLWVALAVGSAWTILLPQEGASAASSEGGPVAQEAEYHTRNPVDRLTRGLPRSMRITVDWIVTIVGAVAIVLLVKAYIVNPYRIPSSSMEPTLHCARPGNDCEARFSDRVLANRFVYHFRDPKRGEIVVFETPPKACGVGGTFVKRVIGLPGDKLEVRLVRGDGYVFINGRKLDEPYVRLDRRQVTTSFGPITVPQDHYFMMGDNREQSCDSREWGSLPRQNLIGKVFATYWPPQRLSLH